MKLITKAIEKAFEKQGDTSEMTAEEQKVILKLFNAFGAGTWYITEYDKKRQHVFGYVTGLGYDELGWASLDELKALRFAGAPRIERDRYWDSNTTLRQVMNGEKR